MLAGLNTSLFYLHNYELQILRQGHDTNVSLLLFPKNIWQCYEQFHRERPNEKKEQKKRKIRLG